MVKYDFFFSNFNYNRSLFLLSFGRDCTLMVHVNFCYLGWRLWDVLHRKGLRIKQKNAMKKQMVCLLSIMKA